MAPSSPQDLRREDGLLSPEERTRILSPSPVNNPYVVLSTIDILSFYGTGGVRGNDNPPTTKELRDG